MGAAARQTALRSAYLHLVVYTVVVNCLFVAQASRSLQQVNSCVVLGSSTLRNCNNQNCYCEGKYPSGNICKCKGECDPTYKICDGNANNQANCDCSRSQLGASSSASSQSPADDKPAAPTTPKQSPAEPQKQSPAAPQNQSHAAPPKQSPVPPPPAKQEAPVENKATGPAQSDSTPTSSPGSSNPSSSGLPLGFLGNLGTGRMGAAGLPVVG